MKSLELDRINVLLAEDSLDDEHLALKALEQTGLRLKIEVARDGEEALEILTRGSAADASWLPELIICDLNLPKISGAEVLRRVRNDPRTANLRFVIFSSSELDQDIERCSSLGVDSYVCKPLEYQDYIDRVREIALRWLRNSE